jgi:hypothetical protein
MAKLKSALQYFFGVLLLIFSIPMLFEKGNGMFGSLVMVIASLICMPFTRQRIEQRLKLVFSKRSKYIIVIAGWCSIGIFSSPITKVESNDKEKMDVFKVPAEENAKIYDDNVAGDKPSSAISEHHDEKESSRHFDTDGNTTNEHENKKANTSIDEDKVVISRTASSTRTTRTVKKKKSRSSSGYGSSNTSTNSRNYITGPRGGCYYINANGNKVYVDHSYCY